MSGVFWSSNASFVGTNSIGIGFIRIRIECSLTSQRSQYDVWLTIRDENQHSHVPQCGIWIRIRDKDLKMYSICMCKFFWHLISRDPTNPWATVYLSNLRCFWYSLFRSKYIGYLFLRLITHGDVSVSKVGNNRTIFSWVLCRDHLSPIPFRQLLCWRLVENSFSTTFELFLEQAQSEVHFWTKSRLRMDFGKKIKNIQRSSLWQEKVL